MTELIAILSTGKGTWAQLYQIIEKGGFSKVYLITNQFGKEKFNKNQDTELIVLDFNLPLKQLSDQMYSALKDNISDLEVGLNFISGTGKEHMALLSAIIKLGIGFRLVNIAEDKVEVI